MSQALVNGIKVTHTIITNSIYLIFFFFSKLVGTNCYLVLPNNKVQYSDFSLFPLTFVLFPIDVGHKRYREQEISIFF